MSLILAVAFLCYMRTTHDFAQGFLASGEPGAYQMLMTAGYDISQGEQRIGTSAKQQWIVFLSLLVCIVGIINAQLMSVTERFREIGTMKCLGALDRFVVRLFILEALMQGLAGSIAGSILGLMAAALSSLINLGPALGCMGTVECSSPVNVHCSRNRNLTESCRGRLPGDNCGQDAAGGGDEG